MAEKNILDVSMFNSVNNYKNAADAVDGVIIRCGYRGYGSGKLVKDNLFDKHISGFTSNNENIGIYFMSTAINAEEGAQEAAFVYTLIKNYKITLPVFIDSEYSNGNHNGRSDKLSKEQRTSVIIGFCEKIKQFGYIPGIYASDSWFKDNLNLSQLSNYKLWVASYGKKPSRVSNYIGWQYTSKGLVNGVPNRVDLSYWYEPIESTSINENNTSTFSDNPYKLSSSSKILRKGSKGEDVRWLQYELNKHAYGLVVDGDFGIKTYKSIADYQYRHNLQIDGIAGPKTIKALMDNIPNTIPNQVV